MSEYVSSSMMEFLGWISSRRRTYVEVMEAWQSTCPRLTVWEDALTDGLIQIEDTLQQTEVTLTFRGRAILDGKDRDKLEGTRGASGD
jgi:hypothetical protein